jgi:hypothetical protein
LHTTTSLLRGLCTVWAPFGVTGQLSFGYKSSRKIFRLSTVDTLNLTELTAAAAQSPGTKSLEIPVEKLVEDGLDTIRRYIIWPLELMCPNSMLKLRARKLVIHQEGGEVDQVCYALRDDGHIGTVVVVLNSEYTGGELEITHGGRTEVVTGPYSWVAMYGDCPHKINPVTSGTRVSLIYDIYFEGSQRSSHSKGSERVWIKRALSVSDETIVRGVDVGAIHTALDEELQKLDSVVICLQHLYPACQAVPDSFKCADAVLYEVLLDHYDVQIVHSAIYHEWHRGYRDNVHAKLITSFEDHTTDNAPNSKVVVYAPPDPSTMLHHHNTYDYDEDEEEDELETEESIFVVTALQVSRRE